MHICSNLKQFLWIDVSISCWHCSITNTGYQHSTFSGQILSVQEWIGLFIEEQMAIHPDKKQPLGDTLESKSKADTKMILSWNIQILEFCRWRTSWPRGYILTIKSLWGVSPYFPTPWIWPLNFWTLINIHQSLWPVLQLSIIWRNTLFYVIYCIGRKMKLSVSSQSFIFRYFLFLLKICSQATPWVISHVILLWSLHIYILPGTPPLYFLILSKMEWKSAHLIHK